MALELDTSEVQTNLSKLMSKADAAIRALCINGAQKMEAYAKANRKWTDRSGSARQRLKGSWEKTSDGFVIKIAHGVTYGVWLEFAHERKYAILLPTVENCGKKEILPAFNNLLDKISLK